VLLTGVEISVLEAAGHDRARHGELHR
jgi:hypothetical protein